MTQGYKNPTITNTDHILAEGVLSLDHYATYGTTHSAGLDLSDSAGSLSGLAWGSTPNLPTKKYKYNEPEILGAMRHYIDRTYGEHYKKDNLECFDAWIARGTASSTFIDTAEKYLWRYGSKKGKNKDDLMKAMHYIMLTIFVDHYKE